MEQNRTIQPFSIAVPDAVLNDLKRRIADTRWPQDPGNTDWSYGTDLPYLRELCAYWQDTFDWRAQEAKINAWPHFRTQIDGNPIHFIHQRGKGPKPIPLIMSHGWPWTFWDLQKVIGPLTDPAAYGGDALDAFDVVIPSLPGFGFSTPLARAGIAFHNVADMWVTLMSRLGYDRFAAQGGDFGAFVTAQLGHKYADRLIGLHVHLAGPLGMITGNAPPRSDYGEGEEDWFDSNERFFASGGGYAAIQSTKPQTLAYGLTDSPAGMAAWLLEKRRDWSDCGGDVERRFSKDDLLTNFTLYWATESLQSSIRLYAEGRRNRWSPAHDRTPVVEAPTGIAIMAHDMVKLPRRWAERYYNLKRWAVIPEGGHFASMEAPEDLVNEIRAFFRALR
jgi:pimeloyl-ACP methyl ester carboxylesterase